MKLEDKLKPCTGVSIPLGALRTDKNSCVGQFTDLIPFADFCKKASLGIIQLLPVNDTGTESSPYSALSAFALHPIYADLAAIPESKTTPNFQEMLSSLVLKYAKEKRYSYIEIRNEKVSILRSIFEANYEKILKLDKLSVWKKENPWIKNYSVFMCLKYENLQSGWKEWKKKYTPKDIDKIYEENERQKELLFFAWMQFRLDEQFSKASAYVRKQGIILKGDIPIMMNIDSADVWANPEYFNKDLRAGSPPDAENPSGQNWGFPIYNWETLRTDGYSWWKDRLKQASKYYDAYRIDHVLGFFRIWATPENETTAKMGWTEPFEPIKKSELLALGFSDERIKWLSLPHVPTKEIADVLGGDWERARNEMSVLMDRIGQEELWLFKDKIKSDKDILSCTQISDSVKNKLCEYWSNRTLRALPDAICPSLHDKAIYEQLGMLYSPMWTFTDSVSWNSLRENEKLDLLDLFKSKQKNMEELWSEHAHRLLLELTSSTSMIPCAEDLGAMPECVPEVLNMLNIMGLRVVRWCRKWDEDKQPFVPFSKYDRMSVTTTSVHDSSTLRQWWLYDADAEKLLDGKKIPEYVMPGVYTPKIAKYLLKEIAKSKSLWCIHPVQDLLAMSARYYSDNPEDERINVPGTVTKFNWTYRLPVTLDKLMSDTALIKAISEVAGKHK